MKETVTKSEWLSAQKCLAMAWYGLRTTPSSPTEAGLFRMHQGKEVGVLARQLYPTGMLVTPADGKTAAEVTEALMAESSTEVLFEASAIAGHLSAKADIIQRHSGGWHVLEVKSSFADTGKLQGLIDDLAYTVFVFQRAGVSVTKASLLLLSRSFRFGGSPDRLFEMVEMSSESLARAAAFEATADTTIASLFSAATAPPMLVSACRECAAFSSQCIGAKIEHTVLELPNLHYKKLARLSAAGIVDLASIPSDLGLNDRQQRAKSSVLSDKLIVEVGLKDALNSIAWPCDYLDFETVATVLPLYSDHGCHDQVLTQFSIHHRDSVDAQPRHSEFLADASSDCQRELADALIAALGERGSVLVYSDFERTRIEALQRAFPDLAPPLQGILARLVDLLPLIADYVYHPEFRGSYSIKQVLPALVPDLSYQELVIRDGDTAITRFARMARGEIPAADISLTRLQLLHYCKLDTLSMVRLHETLLNIASA